MMRMLVLIEMATIVGMKVVVTAHAYGTGLNGDGVGWGGCGVFNVMAISVDDTVVHVTKRNSYNRHSKLY